jgi:hypothetical protein
MGVPTAIQNLASADEACPVSGHSLVGKGKNVPISEVGGWRGLLVRSTSGQRKKKEVRIFSLPRVGLDLLEACATARRKGLASS